jgi:hypothetical protein
LLTKYYRKLFLIALFALALLPAFSAAEPPATPATPAPARSPLGFVKGYTWGWWGARGTWKTDDAAESMRLLAANHADHATVAFVAHMPAHNIPMIAWASANPRMVSDDEIRHAIGLARGNNMKVILKPAVDCLDKKPRSEIDFKTADAKEDAAAWNTWWECYEAFILHYAALAQAEKCAGLIIGCELSSAERFEKQWRSLIPKIRKIFPGSLIYNTAHMREMDVTWWDAVDIIGVGVYYTVGTEKDFSLDTMLKNFEPHRQRLKTLSEKWKRPILFAEIGCRSAMGSQVWPGDHTHWEWPASGEVQANFYHAALKAFWNEPWFCGYVWWDWPAKLYPKESAPNDKQFYIYNKPAEKILRDWYAKPTANQPAKQSP